MAVGVKEPRVKTESPSQDEYELAEQVEELFHRAKHHMRNRHEMWRKSYRLVHNRTWSAWRDPKMPSPTASEVYPILGSLVGWLTDQPTKWEVVPAVDPHSPYSEFYSGLAHDLELVLEALWVNNLVASEIEKMLWDSLIYGTAFGKVSWDTAADDGAGNARFDRVDPFCMYIDPAAHNLEDASYIIEARRMSLDDLERRWPKSGRKVRDSIGLDSDVPDREDPFTGSAGKIPMSNTGGVEGGKAVYGLPGQGRSPNDITNTDSVTVYECWKKENVWVEPDEEGQDGYYVPRWRVIVACGEHILMDEKAVNLWKHGRHPYVMYKADDFGELWGVSLVDHLAPCQLAVNRLLAASQHHAELCANPVLLEDARSGIQRTKIVNQPGQRVTKAVGSEVEWLVPPNMPSDVQALITFWINEMERISGLSAMSRGMTPTGRNAQGVIDSVQESAFVRVRSSLRNMERTLAEAGRLMAHLIVENYDIPRMVAIAGPEGQRSMMALRARHFYSPNYQDADPMKFSLYVTAGAGLPISRSARAQEADTLFAMGAIDHQAVLEAHDYPNRRQILERVNAMMGIGVEAGGGGRNRPEVGPGGSQG